MQFGIFLPTGFSQEFAGIADPVEAYESLTRIARGRRDGLRDPVGARPPHDDPTVGYGFEFGTARTRLARLGEAVQIIRSMWTEDETTFEGEHYRVRGATSRRACSGRTSR